MRDEKKKIRHEAIARAAYALLAQKGYDGTSMLSIARSAKASNETLYRWYGDKRGLFEAMARDNASEIKAVLEQAIGARDDPVEALERFSPKFLEMILGERAILLNRAAAADPSGELGAAISAGGRNEIQPLIEALMRRIPNPHRFDAQDMTDWFVGLLVGDLQIKRAIGVLALPSASEIEARCCKAHGAFFWHLRAG